MRSWHIIAASAAAATIAGAVLFLLSGLPWRSESATLLTAHWPAIAVVWLSTYATAALALTTLAAFFDGTTRLPVWGNRVRGYFAQLAVTQYFTSILALLALGLSRLPAETALFGVLPDPIGNSPALAACGAVVVIGLLGGMLLMAAVMTGERPETGSSAPGIRASRLFSEVGETLPAPAPVTADAVSDAVHPLPAPAAGPANAVVVDAEQLVELIERAQRPVLEAIKDLATSVNRLRRGLGEIKFVLQDRGSRRSAETDVGSGSAAEDAGTQLRAVVAAVDASVARLGEMALLLSASETRTVTGRETAVSPGTRSQLSAELQALLRDLTPAAERGDPPG